MSPPNTRSASSKGQTDDQALFDEINNTDTSDLNKYADLTKVLQLLRFSINQTNDLAPAIAQNSADIAELKVENTQLKSKISHLEEEQIKLDQYSRKNVMVMTGLRMREGETQRELEDTVCSMFNFVTAGIKQFSKLDFIAIHRNGRNYRNDKPPSVTIKFIRYDEKDMPEDILFAALQPGCRPIPQPADHFRTKIQQKHL